MRLPLRHARVIPIQLILPRKPKKIRVLRPVVSIGNDVGHVLNRHVYAVWPAAAHAVATSRRPWISAKSPRMEDSRRYCAPQGELVAWTAAQKSGVELSGRA